MNSIPPLPLSAAKRRHRIITTLAVVAIVVVIGILTKGLSLNPNAGTQALVGKRAKDFRASWLQGRDFVPAATGADFNLSHFAGRPLILNFWASWCQSCQAEAAVMEAFWQAHKAEGVMVVGLAIQDTADDALKFASYFGKTYPLGLDDDGTASIDYGVTGVPETFFIDSSGTIRHKIAGPVEFATLETYLPLLKTPVKS